MRFLGSKVHPIFPHSVGGAESTQSSMGFFDSVPSLKIDLNQLHSKRKMNENLLVLTICGIKYLIVWRHNSKEQ